MVKVEIGIFCIPLRLCCCLLGMAFTCPAIEVQVDIDTFHFHYSYCSSWFIPTAYVGKLGIGSAILRYP